MNEPIAIYARDTSAAQVLTPAADPTFSRGEWTALAALRVRYHRDRDLFSPCEIARLEFVRWLYRTGRLEA
jgi:hypothetical protein